MAKKVRGQSCAIGLEIQQLCLAQLSFYRGIFFSSNYMYMYMYLMYLPLRAREASYTYIIEKSGQNHKVETVRRYLGLL